MAIKFITSDLLNRFWINVKSYLVTNYGLNATTGAYNLTVGSGKMFTSIQAALNTLPKNLGAKDVTITVDAGTYNEDVEILNFQGSGTLTLIGAGTTGAPTTIVKTIYGNMCNVMLYVTNMRCNNTRIWSGTDTFAVGFQACPFVTLENIIVTSAPTTSFISAGQSNINSAGNCVSGAGTYGIQCRHNSFFYSNSTNDWSASGTEVRAVFGGRYASAVLCEDYSDEYGGMVITDYGLRGSGPSFSSTTLANASGLSFRYYPGLGLAMVSGVVTINTGQTLPANTNTTVATITGAGVPDGSRALAAFVAGNGEIKAYLSAAGNLGIRSELALAAGTSIYISGCYNVL